jgi:hypothetical protein
VASFRKDPMSLRNASSTSRCCNTVLSV